MEELAEVAANDAALRADLFDGAEICRMDLQ